MTVIPEPIEQAITEYGLAAAYAGRYNDSHYRADEMKTERAALVAVIAAELRQAEQRGAKSMQDRVDGVAKLVYDDFIGAMPVDYARGGKSAAKQMGAAVARLSLETPE
jgi:hypothetical protein